MRWPFDFSCTLTFPITIADRPDTEVWCTIGFADLHSDSANMAVLGVLLFRVSDRGVEPMQACDIDATEGL